MAVRFSTIHRRIFCAERSICPALTPKLRHFIKPFDDKTVRILSGVQNSGFESFFENNSYPQG
jgi:hypothetical protein